MSGPREYRRGATPVRGRGSATLPDPRYGSTTRENVDDGWGSADEEPPPLKTTVTPEHPRSVINRNQSPDLPFNISINPYRGCEHGCAYCYARPAHAYVDLSPGLDFESRLFSKPDAPARLREELARPGYRCEVLSIGANTDCYQPVERRLGITRGIIEVLAECRHPLTIVTKSALVERDLDLLAPMAADGLVQVFVSVTSLDRTLARRMEPRAANPSKFSAGASNRIISFSSNACRWLAIRSAGKALRLNCRQRDRIVTGSFCGSVVASRNLTCGGGSSRVLSNALKECADSMCTSSIR